MVTVTEASAIVLENARHSAIRDVPLGRCAGRVLAETVTADRDLPPVDRVTMDGIAIAFDAWRAGRRDFETDGVQAAGAPPSSLSDKDRCMEVMTGAALPGGADTVIPYEEVRVEGRIARVVAPLVDRHQNIHVKGSDAPAGTPLLQPGTKISSAEVALLATVGKEMVKVYDLPAAAVVSSGDELVAPGEKPAPHQVRRSNTYAIQAAMEMMGWSATSFHLPDNEQVSTDQLREILERFDTVILSGGVSKGKFDFIPGALERNGIGKRFHRVNQRPGKPFWFGTSADGRKTVFALPGNPVSTYLCFYRYVRPWALRCQQVTETPQFAALAGDFRPPSGLTYFLQVAVRNEQGVLMAYPNAGGGSGDLANLKDVTGFLEIAENNGPAIRGKVFPYIPFRF